MSNTKPVTLKDEPGEEEHSENGPSSLRAIELCPAFENRDRQHEAADEGSLAHLYLQKNLRKHNDKELMSFTEEMQGHIISVWDYMNEHFLEGDFDKWTVFYEKELDLRACNIPKCDKGTVDIIAFPKDGDGTYCKAADYKFGFIEVDDAEKNIQTWMYGVGLWLEFPGLTDIDFEIPQPKAGAITYGSYGKKDMEHFINRAYMIVRRKDQMKVKRRPTPNTEYCRYCARLHKCEPALKVFTEIPEKLLVQIPKKEHFQNMFTNPEAASIVYTYLNLAQKWAEGLKTEISHEVKDGKLKMPTGYRLKERKGNTNIIDLHGIKDFVMGEYDVSEEEYNLSLKPSVTKLKQLVRDKAERGEKQEAEKEFMESLFDGAYANQAAPASWLERIKD